MNSNFHDANVTFSLKEKLLQYNFAHHCGTDVYEFDLAKELEIAKLTNKCVNDDWIMKSDSWKYWTRIDDRHIDWNHDGHNWPVGPVILCKEFVDERDPKKGYKEWALQKMKSRYNDFDRTIWACMREKKHRYMFREGEELR